MVLPKRKLRIAFEITPNPKGGYAAVLHNIDQGSMNVALERVTLTGDTLRLELPSVGFAYEGKIQPEGRMIQGNWIQERDLTPLVLHRVDTVPELFRAQHPRKPYPYVEREVAYEASAAGVRIAGTLTCPVGKGPFPAVLLIGGSGPSERDEAVRGHKPFLVLADHLTRQGLAVLRVDKRGCGKSTGTYPQDQLKDFVEDALAGVAFLGAQPEVEASRIGLIGHSQGGEVAALAAASNGKMAFLVLMAAPGLPFFDSMVLQDGTEAKAAGATSQEVEIIRGYSRRYYQIVLQGQDAPQIERNTRALQASLTDAEQKALRIFGWPNLEGTLGLEWGLLPASRTRLASDIGPTLRSLRCPVLALNGGKDPLVPPGEAIAKALKAGGNPDFTLREVPGLNHFFQTCATGSPAEYLKLEETLSPGVLQTLSTWILTKVPPPNVAP
jgi:hypothetical protein